MSWIKTIGYDDAQGALKKLYDRVKGPESYIDNILLVHSLRPHTLKGHMTLYKNVLHHRNNELPKWILETVGVYVSILNNCDYCVTHHFEGLNRLINDPLKSQAIRSALDQRRPELYFDGTELALIRYAELLTLKPFEITQTSLADLRAFGVTDGEILEVNQVVSYFAYANRTVLGLGVSIDGDILGLSPGHDDSDDDWSHS